MENVKIDDRASTALMELAHTTIRVAVANTGGARDPIDPSFYRVHPALSAPAGAFVTIYVSDQLRGCLGQIEAIDPLAEVVARMAARVPLHDHRFPSVSHDELRALRIKISVLGPLIRVNSLDEVQIGGDGLLARRGKKGGLLLPEVPVERGWDLPTYLANLWRKANLEPDVPVSKVKLWRFQTRVISSEDIGED